MAKCKALRGSAVKGLNSTVLTHSLVVVGSSSRFDNVAVSGHSSALERRIDDTTESCS